MRIPQPRGELGAELARLLLEAPGPRPCLAALARCVVGQAEDVLADEDVQTSLTVLYELHYRGFEGVDPDWEWEPDLLGARAVLERAFEAALRDAVPEGPVPASEPGEVARALFELTGQDGGPSTSAYLDRRADVGQFREFLVHRSIYHLKEADPHTWAIPRLAGRAKAAMVEVQADEYGGGRVERMHASLFARTMRALGLDDSYGHYLDRVPGVTLATVNAMSMLGLHRRLRGAVVGHLTAVEMTSSLPNRRYGNGLRRLGYDPDATWFFDEHVEADAAHEQIAAHDMAGSLALEEPALVPDVMFGARVALYLDERFATHVLGCWEQGGSSLLPLVREGTALVDVA